MLPLINYYFLYQELCLFVYRPVKKLHNAPLNKLREATHIDLKHRGVRSLFPLLERATCTVICRVLTWHCWCYLSLSSAKLRTASQPLFRLESSAAVSGVTGERAKYISCRVKWSELRLVLSVKEECDFYQAHQVGSARGFYAISYAPGISLDSRFSVVFCRFYLKTSN